MRTTRATGRKAAVIKYDLLTALGALGCAGDKHLQRLVLRLITLIVARYNWQADTLTVGQREIAALWAVDERTVKREMAKLRDRGWLVVRQPAARGRVASYGLDLAAILAETAPGWDRVGPDFAARMRGPAPGQPAGNVISFPAQSLAQTPAQTSPGPPQGKGLWPQVQARLMAENPALYGAWFAMLEPDGDASDRLVLRAPSRFHASFVATHHLARLERLARQIEPGLRGIEVTG